MLIIACILGVFITIKAWKYIRQLGGIYDNMPDLPDIDNVESIIEPVNEQSHDTDKPTTTTSIQLEILKLQNQFKQHTTAQQHLAVRPTHSSISHFQPQRKETRQPLTTPQLDSHGLPVFKEAKKMPILKKIERSVHTFTYGDVKIHALIFDKYADFYTCAVWSELRRKDSTGRYVPHIAYEKNWHEMLKVMERMLQEEVSLTYGGFKTAEDFQVKVNVQVKAKKTSIQRRPTEQQIDISKVQQAFGIQDSSVCDDLDGDIF